MKFRSAFVLALVTGIVAGGLRVGAVEAPLALEWAQQIGSTGTDQSSGVTVDGTGNVYLTGLFSGTVTVGGQSITSRGNTDIFLAKYNPAGALLWFRQAGGHSADEGDAVAVDNAGNVYVAGLFGDTGTFGETNIVGQANVNIFVAKYDSGGNLAWTRRAGGTSNCRALALAVDGNGNAFLSGSFQGTATFGQPGVEPLATNLVSSGQSDIFIAKYNTSGLVQWARGAGGSADDQGQGIAVDGAGNVYVTGYFSGNVSFDNIE